MRVSDTTPAPATVNTSELGTSDTAYMGSMTVGIEKLSVLRGRGWWDAVKEMSEQDPTIGAILFAIEMTMRRATIRVEAADDPNATECQRWADFVEECRNDMQLTWADFMSEVMTFISYGKSLFEVVYKRRLGDDTDPSKHSHYDDGLVAWSKLGYRAPETQRRWVWANQRIVSWEQNLTNGGLAVIPMEKLVLFRTAARGGNPDGFSMLKRVYTPWYHKMQIQVIEGVGLERDLAGLLVVMLPDSVLKGTTAEDVRELAYWKKVVRNIKRGTQEGILASSQRDNTGNARVEVKLMNSGGVRQFDTSKIIERYRSEIVTAFLAGFMTLGQQGTGSYALGETLADFFRNALSAWLDMICEAFTEQAIHRLMIVNGVDRRYWPKLGHDDPDSMSLQVLATYITALKNASILDDSYELAKSLHERAGLPAPSQDDWDAKKERAAALTAKLLEKPTGPTGPSGPTGPEALPTGTTGASGGTGATGPIAP